MARGARRRHRARRPIQERNAAVQPSTPEQAAAATARAEPAEAKGEAAPLPAPQAPLVLRVSGLAGELGTVTVDVSWSVPKVKEAIEALTGVPRQEQVLLLGLVQLQNQASSLAHAIQAVGNESNEQGGPRQTLDLTLLRRTPVHQSIGWNVRHDDRRIVLRHSSTGFIVELVGGSVGWFNISDGSGTDRTVYSSDAVEPDVLSDRAKRLSEEAAAGEPEQWLEDGDDLTVEEWFVRVAHEQGARHLLVSHSQRGEVLRLGRLTMDVLRHPSGTSPANRLFQQVCEKIPCT